MATLKPELKTILDRYGINPSDRSQVWDCHGVLVLYHKAYEIIAAKEAIRFDPPTVIEGSSERKTVALLVVGHMGDRAEWSIGEAAPGNTKNAYPYAMAEKRAKDRVIAKLVGLAAYIYSEDEADDLKDAKPAPKDEAPPPEIDADEQRYRDRVKSITRAIDACGSLSAVNTLMVNYGWNAASKVADPDTALAEIRARNIETYDFLLRRAEDRRNFFASHPDDKKAA